jgi:hypothetical protein
MPWGDGLPEGDDKSRRMDHFRDMAEVKTTKAAPGKVVKAWVKLMG